MGLLPLLILTFGGYMVYKAASRAAPPVALPEAPPDYYEPPPEKEPTPEEKINGLTKAAKDAIETGGEVVGTAAAVGTAAEAVGLTPAAAAAAPTAATPAATAPGLGTTATVLVAFAAVAAYVTAIAYIVGQIDSYRKRIKKKKELTTQAIIAATARADSGKQLQEIRRANRAALREIVNAKEQLGLDAIEDYRRWKVYSALIPIDYWNVIPANVPRVEELYAEAYEGLTPEETAEVLDEGQANLGQADLVYALVGAAYETNAKARRAKKRAKEVLLLLLGHLHYLAECQKDIERELKQSDLLADEIMKIEAVARAA